MKDVSQIRYLSRDNILSYYRQMECGDNSFSMCRKPEELDSLLEEVRNDNAYPTIEDKTALLLCSMVQEHYFTDGNKRLAVVTGALFLIINGYEKCIDAYTTTINGILLHIINGNIGFEIVRDIIASILNGEDFSEELKMLIYLAIEDDDRLTEEGIIPDEWCYFEKQRKTTQRADNRNSVDTDCQSYPCLKLVFNDDWDDYGQATWFSLWLVYDKKSVRNIGDVKIMHVDGDVYKHLPETFSCLTDEYCSLGLDTDYYRGLQRVFGNYKSRQIVKALHDAAISEAVYEKYSTNDIFRDSLCRDLSSETALKEAKLILSTEDKHTAYSFEYIFTPVYNRKAFTRWSVDVDYDSTDLRRLYAVIGENGVGKTQLLSDFIRDLTSKDHSHLNRETLLSGALVVCSSKLDAYYTLPQENRRIPLKVTNVLQNEETIGELIKAIGVIVNRGTLYLHKAPVSLYELYQETLKQELDGYFVQKRMLKDGEVNKDYLKKEAEKMSTGQFQIFALVTNVFAYIHLHSLVLLDEPEVHLHPKLIESFFVTLSRMLSLFDSYAVMATHSPLIIRECVKKNVYILKRNEDDIPMIGLVPFRTLGENVGLLYNNVFGCDENDNNFCRIIKKYSSRGRRSYREVVEKLRADGAELSINGLDIVAECLERRAE